MEIQNLEKEKKKNLQNMEIEKNNFINEIKKTDKDKIKNSEVSNKNYSIWSRIRAVLRMS